MISLIHRLTLWNKQIENFMRKLIILISFTFVTNLGLAQSFNVKGVVTDVITGETLPGVNVIVKNSQKGDVTDFDGNYKISADRKSVV